MLGRRPALLLLLALAACAHERLKGGLAPVAGLTPAAVEAAVPPRKVALLVGIDGYDDPFWPALRYAAKDARDFGQALANPAEGGFDEVVVLSTRAETARARLLEEVAKLAKKAPRADDTVVLYLSGHGTLAPKADGSLERVIVTSDAKSEATSRTGLTVGELARAFEALPSRRKVLVLATCHSGGGKGLLTADAERWLRGVKGPAPLEAASRATLVLSAADFGQPAREDDRLENDVYTHFLVEALARGADANGDGAVSATEAHDWARRRTFEFTDGRQIPTVESLVVGADPVILAGRIERPGLPVLYSYAERLRGAEVRAGGRSKGVLPGDVVLEPGEQQLQIVAGGATVYDGPVSLDPGRRLAADELLDAAQPHWAASARVAGLFFAGSQASTRLAAPVVGLDVSLRRRALPVAQTDLVLDFLAANGDQHVAPAGTSVGQSLTAMGFGTGLAFTGTVADARVWAGPHLTVQYVGRSLRLEGLDERQSFAAALPGAFAGAAFSADSWEFVLEGRAHYLPLVVNGQVLSMAATSVSAGIGRRF